MMPVNTGRRKLRLTPQQKSLDGEEFTIEEIATFIEQHDDRDPEVVSVTVELDDLEAGIGTTN